MARRKASAKKVKVAEGAAAFKGNASVEVAPQDSGTYLNEEVEAVQRALSSVTRTYDDNKQWLDGWNEELPTKVTKTHHYPGAYTTKLCTHDGTKLVWVSPDTGVEFFCANSSGINAFGGYDFILDCGKVLLGAELQRSFISSSPERFKALNKFTYQPAPAIRLDWPDQHAPPVHYAFWSELLKLFPPNAKVCICCIGSHGRTGTALAMLILAGTPGLTGEEAITWVRKNHCTHAIESKAQEAYIKGWNNG